MEQQNRRMNEAEFGDLRQRIREGWPTGAGVDFEEAVSYQKEIPRSKRFTVRLETALTKGETLIQPRAGVALVDQQIALLKHLAEAGQADLLPTTVDSYTRQNRYQEAQKGITESEMAGRSLLNGFPIVNHGVRECRRLNEALDLPVQVRHGTPDARLLAEISMAGGFTSF